MMPYQLRALKWAVQYAADWRGSLVGNPDPKPLAAFDRQIAKAQLALKTVCRLAREDRKRRGLK